MTDGAMHPMSAEIGGLKADVRNLQGSIDRLNQMWGQREEAASNGRSVIHKKLEDVGREMYMLSAEVENVKNEIVEIKPAIEEFKNQRQRAIGAKRLGGFLWAAMVAGAAVLGWSIHELIVWFRH